MQGGFKIVVWPLQPVICTMETEMAEFRESEITVV